MYRGNNLVGTEAPNIYPLSLELQLGGKGTQPHELSCTKCNAFGESGE
jgi:hypothetical protein